ncbi:CGNR zinc finger domain-containing protein [Actinocrispum wychmicini]|uniref:Putative RNA-binding Zn ribbon-like protein n=1 Tax=Actinocrispum wychmicini TaxID=1213861 RepID=A0A4R2JP20_9PSEU|nr:CGNR zinc finger domain-containing protein [Actinocrispum wychmicini]TCO55905.1 putative RNA-binding Zn ribbon-like protein [Actinocrispum wychmicini]
MNFGTYAGRALHTAVDLINSDDLSTGEAAATLLRDRGWTVDQPLTPDEVERLRALRPVLRYIFTSSTPHDGVRHLNAVLADMRALPQLTNHDGAWHWHYVQPDADLVDRVTTRCAVALLSVVADAGASRLRTCAADDCTNVFVDLSRNSARRFCDARTCGNRTHAAAYRARRRDNQPQ